MRTPSEYRVRLRGVLCLLLGAAAIADCADSKSTIAAPKAVARDEIAARRSHRSPKATAFP